MKKPSSIIFLLLFIIQMNAQETTRTIRGTVRDTNGNSVSEAFVLLSDTTSNNNVAYVEIGETDSIGQFCISTPKAFNKILINRIGYKPTETKVTPADSVFIFTMQNDKNAVLEEVTVRGYKKIVHLDSKGLTYDMTKNPIQKGNTLDAMRFIPLVQVNRESINIVGKDNVKFFVNGKELKLTGNALTAYIQSIPTQDIKQVEIITSYNARFATNANQGAVNFILKKKENEGLKGQVSARTWKTHYLKGQGNVMLSYNKSKLSTNLFLTGQHGSTWQERNINTDYIGLDKKTSGNSTYDGKSSNGSVQAILNYDLTANSSLSGQTSVEYSKSNRGETGSLQFLKQSAQTPYAQIKHNNSEDSETKRISAGITYQTSGQNGNLFRTSLNYYYGDVRSSVWNKMDSILENKTSPHQHYQEIIPQKSNVWSGDALYTVMFGEKGSLDMELKAYYWKINNNDRFYHISNNIPVLDDLRSQHLKVDEWNMKATLSWTQHWSKQVESVAGFGMTRRNYLSEQLRSKESYKQNYWQPNPFLIINFTPSDKLGLRYDINYKTENPTFDQMNPFKWYSSATTYKMGNPTLKQTKNISQNLMAQLFQKVVFSINHFHVDDGIVDFRRVKENGMIETRPENLQESDMCYFYVGVNNISYWKNRGNLNISLDFAREWYRASLPDMEDYNRVENSHTIQMNNFVMLSQRWGIQMINNVSYYSKRTYGLMQSPASFNFYTSIQKSIRNWTFSINGFVNGYIYDSGLQLKGTVNYQTPELHTFTLTKGESVSYGIQIGYSFGNKQVKDARRKQSSSASVRNRLK